MGTPAGKFAQLGGDDVIRFLDAEHFLDELDGNLGRGRAIVRTRRRFSVEDRIDLEIEAPHVAWTVRANARVVVVRDGFVGLELMHFDEIAPELKELAVEVEAAHTPPAEKTVIAPMPDLSAPRPSATVVPDPEPASEPPVDRSVPIAPSRAMGARRRRPRPIPHDPPEGRPEEPSRDVPRPAPHRRPEPSRSPELDPRSEAVTPSPDDNTAALEPLRAEAPARRSDRPDPVAPSTLSSPDLGPTADLDDSPPDPFAARTPPPSQAGALGVPRFNVDAATDPDGSSSARAPTAPPQTAADDPDPPPEAKAVAEPEPPPRFPKPRATSAVTAPVAGTPPPLLEADDLVLLREGTLVAKNPLSTPARTRDDSHVEPATSIEALPSPRTPEPRSETLTAEVEEEPGAKTTAAPLSDDLETPPARPETDAAPPPEAQKDEPEPPETPAEDPSAAPPPAEATAADLPAEPVEAPPSVEPPAPAPELQTGNVGVEDLEVPPEAAPAPEPEPRAAPEPEPPAPAVPLDNLEALADKHPSLPRVTRGGVLRISDAATLLGLYLSQVRHGRLTVYGPLEGAPGDETTIKMMGGTVVSMRATILARVGEWVTLEIPYPEPMQDVLRDSVADWQADLPAEAAPAAPAAAPSSPPATITPDAPDVLTPPPPPSADLEAPPLPAAAAPSSPPEADGPPEVPKLAGDRVVFRRRKDLAHEIGQNLANGGLFVDAPPLPLRTKRQLSVQVGTDAWGVVLQADVVFADAGRVGFSVVNAAEAVAQLKEVLDGAPLPSKSEPGFDSSPPSADGSAGADTRSLSEDGEAYIGSLAAPITDEGLLGLPDRRITELSSVVKTSVLQLVEYVVSHRWKGVLKLESADRVITTWFHEGSVAFALSKPHDESSSIGRVLINQKKLNEAALREALDAARASKKSLGRALVSLGHIKKSDLSAALREQMRLKLEDALVLESGSFEWTPWREPPGDADLVLTKGIGVLAHHLRHRFENKNLQELEALFGKNLARPVGHDDDLDQSTQGMHLQPKELRFLQLQLDGHRSIEDAVRGSPVGRLASLRLIGLGLTLGVLHFTVGGRAMRESTRIGVVPNRFDALQKDLQETLHLFDGMNHFEVLGVHWSAHHRTYKDAYDKAKKQYDASGRGLKQAPKEVREIARKVTARIEDAFGVLREQAKRADYRKKLFDATERQYAADMLVKQGEVALMRGDRVGAMEALETAVELDPTRRNRQLLTTAREGRR